MRFTLPGLLRASVDHKREFGVDVLIDLLTCFCTSDRIAEIAGNAIVARGKLDPPRELVQRLALLGGCPGRAKTPIGPTCSCAA